MNGAIVNKIAQSELITLDPVDFLAKGETVVFDLKNFLFMEMILKEKDFREAMKAHDWQQYANKNVALLCSVDAIIPVWAWMLAVSNLQPVAKEVVMGDEKDLRKYIFQKNIAALNIADYNDKRVVIKGCGETPIEDYVYMELTKLFRPVAKSIMYGEPCSTVPVFKKPRI